MHTRIGHVHITYRVPKGSVAASLAVPMLERVAREHIARSCDAALSGIFEDDPVVYVLRKVSTRVAVLAPRAALESRVAEQWGHRICAAVVRSISRTEDPDNVVRFENQAEFVSSFLTDLVAGDDAWTRWYYGAFRTYRDLIDGDAVLGILRDNNQHLWEILTRLRKSNCLDAVLDRLGLDGQRKLWIATLRETPSDESAEAFRIFVQSAFRLVDSLEIWSGARPSESNTLHEYLRARPASPQWISAVSLAEAVSDIIRFLAREGSVTLAGRLSVEKISRLEQTLGVGFDWLDTSYLLRRIISITEAPAAATAATSLVLRPPGATPVQRKLLDALRHIVMERRIDLDLGDGASDANLLRLVAALSEQSAPESIALVTALLTSIVETWMALRRTRRLADSLSQLRRGGLEQILDALGPESGDTIRHLQTVTRAGEPAIKVVEELARQSGDCLTSELGSVIESGYAGLFLLVRGVQDIRLSAVLSECRFESMEPLLTGLAIVLGGTPALHNGVLDAGAALWAGIEPEDALSQLARLEVLDRDRFETILIDLLADQRVLDPANDSSCFAENHLLPCSAETAALLNRTAARLLRGWSQWLPGLGGANGPYLLNNFIRRRGEIALGPRHLEVYLEPGPLDAILKMAGCFEDSPAAAWLGNRSVRFRVAS